MGTTQGRAWDTGSTGSGRASSRRSSSSTGGAAGGRGTGAAGADAAARRGRRRGWRGCSGWPARTRRRAGPRVRRGDVRVAILAVLAEEPLNGYQVIQQIAERTDGAWRPSPGSVYPTISQLEDEGLVEGDDERGRRTLRLSDAGRDLPRRPRGRGRGGVGPVRSRRAGADGAAAR